MRAMTEEHFAILRRHMVEVIAIHAELASEALGKAVLDDGYMGAMARVPRHRFVPAPLRPSPTTTRRCRSASTRRSRSRSLSRS